MISLHTVATIGPCLYWHRSPNLHPPGLARLRHGRVLLRSSSSLVKLLGLAFGFAAVIAQVLTGTETIQADYLTFEVSDFTRLPVPDGSQGAVVAMYALVHLPRGELRAPIAEFARVLAPGGLLLVALHEGVLAAPEPALLLDSVHPPVSNRTCVQCHEAPDSATPFAATTH